MAGQTAKRPELIIPKVKISKVIIRITARKVPARMKTPVIWKR